MDRPTVWLNRALPDEFVTELAPGGRLRWVGEFAAENQVALHTDLVLVGDLKPGRRAKVHIYGGTAGLLSVVWFGAGKAALDFKDTFPASPLDPDWHGERPLEELASLAPALLPALRAKAVLAAGTHGKEGPVQVAVMRGGPGWTALDREVVPQHPTDTLRKQMRVVWETPVSAARARVAEGHAWAANWKPKGNELDCLAVDEDGDLLAVEVKTGDASDLEQAPLQVALYTRMIERCLTESPVTLEGLRRTAAQRERIGLCPAAPRIADQPRVRPVIALGAPVGARAGKRWPLVLQALKQEGFEAPEVWVVAQDGDENRIG